jgi:hypothetical protein
MKPNPARIADIWCRLMHRAPMWPSHGHYECRTCGRRHAVCWEQPASAAPRVRALSRQAQGQSVLVTGAESRIPCT